MNFYHSKATKVYNCFSAHPIKWSRTMLYVFESRVTKNQRNTTKLVLCFCQLLPQPWENFRIIQGISPSGQKKSSQITKSLNYRGISVRVLRILNFVELMNVRKADCSKRSKLKFLKIKLSLFSSRKIFESNIFLLKILPFRQIIKLEVKSRW